MSAVQAGIASPAGFGPEAALRRLSLAKDAEGAKEEQGGSPNGNPFSHRDAECTENVPPGSKPGRGFIDYKTDPFIV